MTFQESVKTVLTQNYFNLQGRASRSEYWWFFLAYLIGGIIASLLGWVVQTLYSLALLAPLVSVGFRRMQDTGRPGWYYLIPTIYGFVTMLFTPGSVELDANGMPIAMPSAGAMGFSALLGIIGLILVIVFIWWLTRPSQPETNAYGPPPAT